jgi:hypothetical protein
MRKSFSIVICVLLVTAWSRDLVFASRLRLPLRVIVIGFSTFLMYIMLKLLQEKLWNDERRHGAIRLRPLQGALISFMAAVVLSLSQTLIDSGLSFIVVASLLVLLILPGKSVSNRASGGSPGL